MTQQAYRLSLQGKDDLFLVGDVIQIGLNNTTEYTPLNVIVSGSPPLPWHDILHDPLNDTDAH